MKAKNIRLIVSMVLLIAAATFTTTPADAQRRSSETNREVKTETRKSSNSSSRSEQKSATKSQNQKRESIKAPSDNKRNDIEKPSRKIERGNYEKAPAPRVQDQEPRPERNNQKNVERTSPVEQPERNNPRDVETNRPGRSDPGDLNRSEENLRNSRPNDNRSGEYNRPDRNAPSRDYKGSDRYWSERERPNINNNRDSRNFSHWDRSWENYRWNDRSWYDYYHGYRPYSYKYHKHYYHHPKYGHVIKRFVVKPVVFVFNHTPFYCYDGYFFNYRRGVGYILTDLPYGVVFPELPYDYERVFINGYLYYRVGNLFFEYDGFGYRLVYYPELFLAYR